MVRGKLILRALTIALALSGCTLEAERPRAVPEGVVDSVSSEGVVSGWAYDQGDPARSILVHIYLDGAAGTRSAEFVGTVLADRPRPDLNKNMGLPGNHGFSFQLPASARRNVPRKVFAAGWVREAQVYGKLMDKGAVLAPLVTPSPSVHAE